jgi:hypothetical protein
MICVECGQVALAGGRDWQAHLTDDEPADVATYRPRCAEAEFSASDR